MAWVRVPGEELLPAISRDGCQQQPSQAEYAACIQGRLKQDGQRKLLFLGSVLGGAALLYAARGWHKMFGVALLGFGLMRASLDADLRRAQ